MNNIIVFFSGRGSTFKAIADAIDQGILNAHIKAVITHNPDAKGLEIAHALHIPAFVVPSTANRADDNQKIHTLIKPQQPDYLVLAGYMRILSAPFVQQYAGKIINIHPSLLPKFKGLKTHHQVIAHKEKHHGATTHFVNEKLDEGPSIMQCKIAIQEDDTPETLAARLLPLEHRLYIQTLKLILNKQIYWKNEHTYFNNAILEKPLILE